MAVDNNFAAVLSKITWDNELNGFLSLIMIGEGILVVLIALLGCIGLLWCNRRLLHIYATVATILMILQLIGFGIAFSYKNRFEIMYDDPLLEIFMNAFVHNNTKAQEAFHKFEDSVNCCGINGKNDYETYGITPPPSCLKITNTKGCVKAINDIFEQSFLIIGSSLGGILVLEVLCFIFTLILAKKLAHAKEKTYSSNPGEVILGLVPSRRANYRNFQ
ncbi:unnamed protein product [Adineta steineri]|uniref:Tetraspanin n=1 Tax=Adineta steineri TaxID=433720 RepID=A0A819ZGM4_9BILA|nr:unnamed protein product [Adineta steineri]CAF4168245.1 unnamed protein product [Adineta steineri]